jgi:hypothetical protein
MFVYTIIQTGVMASLFTYIKGFVFLSDAIEIASFEVYSHWNTIYILVVIGFSSVLFSWIVWEAILRHNRFPILCDIEDKVKDEDWTYLIKGGDSIQANSNYLKRFATNEPFSSIVANSFTKTDSKFFLRIL